MTYPLTPAAMIAYALARVQEMTPAERAQVAEKYADASADDDETRALTYKIRQLAAENRSAPTGRDSRIPEEYADCPYEFDDYRYADWCAARTVHGVGRVRR